MKYCCNRFQEEHEGGFIREPCGDKNSAYYDRDKHWHVAWEWMPLIELKYCPFCGERLKSWQVK